MRIIVNKYIPVKGYKAINLFGVIFARKALSSKEINHELIHTQQMKELLYVGFYLLYLLEYIICLMYYWDLHKAYKNICFEKEAYTNEYNDCYLSTRKRFNFIKYM